MKYFSDGEEGERHRKIGEISGGAWGGIKALISARVVDGSFGMSFPDPCFDGRGVVGSDSDSFWRAMQSDIPNLQALTIPVWYGFAEMPKTLDILDIIQFCWKNIAQPSHGRYHPSCDHHHLLFDVGRGRWRFREAINTIFGRNSLAYELKNDGNIRRLVPPVLREALSSTYFQTDDAELNRILESARSKFLSPDDDSRREALEKLWDGWERLKTHGEGPGKKEQCESLLHATAGTSSPLFRIALESDARELTKLGNKLQIRHSELDTERVARVEHIDYLFHRLFSLILVILRVSK